MKPILQSFSAALLLVVVGCTGSPGTSDPNAKQGTSVPQKLANQMTGRWRAEGLPKRVNANPVGQFVLSQCEYEFRDDGTYRYTQRGWYEGDDRLKSEFGRGAQVDLESFYHAEGRKLTIEEPNSLPGSTDLMLAPDLKSFGDTASFNNLAARFPVTFRKE